MSTFTEESLFNTSVVLINTLLSSVSDTVLYAIGLTSNVTEGCSHLSALPLFDWQALFSYDDFQVILLKVFLFILAFNLVSIYIAWKIYGKNIYETFMKPVTPKIIEDLKKSVSRLNLPKEHSPRV
ncbi:T-cell leukemia translocation-altered gene protein-like protein [Frankliniella fusca]|uniref:T-cell leukemia translocation-altered gene protein-like protein n=1 Tax=Frankliniella fusca TaxID=407009 RepID=A0AAE1LBL2_9NEOP|nr:T-cell leukemia translocation-altered gene protein-like protein [Frankliniella fusca]